MLLALIEKNPEVVENGKGTPASAFLPFAVLPTYRTGPTHLLTPSGPALNLFGWNAGDARKQIWVLNDKKGVLAMTTRRQILTALPVAGAAAIIPGVAVSAAPIADAELLRLGTEFNQANQLRQAATDRLLEAEGQGLPFKMLSEAEDAADQASEAVGAIVRRIMDTRAQTPAGMLLKLDVGEARFMDEDGPVDEENIVLSSLKADLEALAKGS